MAVSRLYLRHLSCNILGRTVARPLSYQAFGRVCPKPAISSIKRTLLKPSYSHSLDQIGYRCISFSVIRWSPVHVDSTQSGADKLSLSAEGRKIEIPLIWLRDHCRCDVCYNATTFQKNVDNYSLDGELRIMDMKTTKDTITVKWQDGHSSVYSLEWITNNFFSPPKKVERFLWDGPGMEAQTLPEVMFAEHMNTEEGLKQTLSNILFYGFSLVNGVPATEGDTGDVASRICFLLETVYGRTSVMTSNVLSHSDTAYTNQALGAHTDNTYFSLPSGIQVFHCLQHDGEGGETLLVDGFRAAEKLRQSNPSFFDILTRMMVPHEYIEGNYRYHLRSLGTVLSTDSSGQLMHIRFNPYDRGALTTLPADDIPNFYASYGALTRLIRSKESEFWIKLRPGSVLLVDNWRVLHGRSGFTGKRVLCGCYLPRDDWLSKARVLGLAC